VTHHRHAQASDAVIRRIDNEIKNEQRRTTRSQRRKRAREQAVVQKSQSRDPMYWACRAEARVNGLLQQVVQNLDESHPLSQILQKASDELSDFVYYSGSVPESPVEEVVS
jgi:hypothetical protein